MSDFTSSFWSWYVGGITVVSMLACLLAAAVVWRQGARHDGLGQQH